MASNKNFAKRKYKLSILLELFAWICLEQGWGVSGLDFCCLWSMWRVISIMQRTTNQTNDHSKRRVCFYFPEQTISSSCSWLFFCCQHFILTDFYFIRVKQRQPAFFLFQHENVAEEFFYLRVVVVWDWW